MTEPRYRITLHGRTATGVTVVLLDAWVRVGDTKVVPVVSHPAEGPGEELGRLEVRYMTPDEVDSWVRDMRMAEALEQRLLDELALEVEMPRDPFDPAGESDG